MLVVQALGPLPAAAAVPLPVVAVLPGAEHTSLVVDVGAGTAAIGDGAVEVTAGGAAQQATMTPVISDRLAVTLVVDASEAGRATLPGWLSAAARFILEVPAGTRAAAVADTSPPAVLAPPQRGPAGVVRALSAVQARGDRRTSTALTLALDQFAAPAAGPRVVVLYTAAPDAGGETAEVLAARIRRAATILVVVGTAGSTYWADVTRATGGFFAPAGTPVVVPALDQVETTLRGRYLVRFPTPGVLPARVSVRIDTGGLVLTGDAVIPAEQDAGPASGAGIDPRWWVLAAGLTVLAAAAFLLSRRARPARPALRPAPAPASPSAQTSQSASAQTSQSPPAQVPRPTPTQASQPAHGQVPRPAPTPDSPPAPAPLIARGRAAVPPPVARGRSPVPRSRPEGPPSAPP